MKSQSQWTGRLGLCAVASLVIGISNADAQEASTGPKLRILSSRGATAESSSSSVVFESASAGGADTPEKRVGGSAAEQQSSGNGSSHRPGAAAKGQPAKRSVATSASPGNGPASTTAAVAAPAASTPAQLAAMKRTLALQRVNTMNQAAGPRDAGIPQKPGAATVRATTQAREAIARDASTHEPELPSGPEKFAPSAGEGLTSHDPLASEVSRQGDSYYFSGSLNGVAVRFRINRDVFGIKIPTRLANAAKIIAPEVQASLARQNDVISPINTISFGAYPVKSVMAKIYVDRESDVIDVGPDALASFKIKDFNGRRMLVRL